MKDKVEMEMKIGESSLESKKRKLSLLSSTNFPLHHL